MSTVLLDTHVVHWWSADPQRVSGRASAVLDQAEELAVSAISWFELAWLARHERIVVNIPIRSWLLGLAAQVRTLGLTQRSPTPPWRSPHPFQAIPPTG